MDQSLYIICSEDLEILRNRHFHLPEKKDYVFLHILVIYMKQYKTTMKAENELIVFCYKSQLYRLKASLKSNISFSVLGKQKI